jgi:hypothetical protein
MMEMPAISVPLVLRVLGWLVLVGGSLASVGIFWIDHMNPALWTAMAISVAASVVCGSLLLWLGRRRGRSRTGDQGDAAGASAINGKGP